MNPTKFLLLVFGLLLGLFSSSAFAYVPPSEYMIKQMVAKRSGLKTLRFKSSVVKYSDEKPTDVHFKQITTYDVKTGVLRSVAQDETGNVLYVSERLLSQSPLANRVLFDARADALTSALVSDGLPVRTEAELVALPNEIERRGAEVTSFGRVKDRQTWIIGVSEKSQLWIEKDTFLPVQLHSSKQDSTVRFENYQFQKEVPVPKVISALDGDKTMIREEVGELSINGEIKITKESQQGFTDAGNSASSDTRDLIQKFYRLMR